MMELSKDIPNKGISSRRFRYINFNTPENWTISDIVGQQAIENKDRIAIEFLSGSVWTYSCCLKFAFEAAGKIKTLGIKKDEALAVMTESAERFIYFWLGAAILGVRLVALNTGLRGNVLSHQLRQSESKLVVHDEGFSSSIQLCGSKVSHFSLRFLNSLKISELGEKETFCSKPSDISCIMFTSGTSGPSKGVLMPEAHCILFGIGTIENYNLLEKDIFYICLPLFHANGLFMQLLASFMAGGKAVIRDKFSASNWLEDIRKSAATHTNLLGATATFVIAQPETDNDKDHNLKVIGAAPLASTSELQFRNRFSVESVIPLYGMTEVNIPLYGKLNELGNGSCGKTYAKFFEVEIRNSITDQPVQFGATGEIMVRPKLPFGFMAGYIGMAEKTIEAWRNFWFHTGDAGFQRSNGEIVFVDRIKDCIRRRGENISSYEVEQAFLKIKGVIEVAAYGVPAGGNLGMEEEVMVSLLLSNREELDLAGIREESARNLPKYAIPRYIRVVNNFPKTMTGKVKKVELREEGITTDTLDFVN